MTTVTLHTSEVLSSVSHTVKVSLSLPVVVPDTLLLQASTNSTASTAFEEQNLDDEALMLAMCRGAEWAMDMLYQRYHRYAYALAYRILRDRSAAEDIVQEAFLSIWRKSASYQEQQGSVRNWLQAIVHHRAIDKVRSAAHHDHQWTPLQTENEQDPPGEQPEVWEEVWSHERTALIRSTLALLPAEQRHVIELAYFCGHTHVEIAQFLQLPLGTVKGRMRLGLRKMRQMLCERGLESAC